MFLRSIRNGILVFVIALTALFAFVTPSFAQRGGRGGMSAPPPPPEDPDVTDYKAFDAMKDSDKKVKLGQDFLVKYPKSRLDSQVYKQLVNAYFNKQDWDNFYATSDKALAADPDDVDILTIVGWVIPHVYDQNDPNAKQRLEKASAYEKHSIEVMQTMVKPASVPDDQFATYKAAQLSKAHSGLGLVYFRKGDFDNAAKELALSTQDNTSPDPTDLYAMALSLEQLNRFTDAADAFQKCSEMPGTLQERCQSSADQARGKALLAK